MGVLYTTTKTGRTRTAPTPRKRVTAKGPGTELAAIFSRLGIEHTPTCSCRSIAAKMDARGAQWCRDHLEEIIDGMEREIANRKKQPLGKSASLAACVVRAVPFSRLVAKLFALWAIRRASRR